MIQFVFLERVTISGLRGVRSCITKMRVGGWGLNLLLLKINADAYARRIPSLLEKTSGLHSKNGAQQNENNYS
jgi:hypothetical protein